MVHLLWVACSSKEPLADALPQITDELHQLGASLLHNLNSQYLFHFVRKILKWLYCFLKPLQILSEGVLDLASNSFPDFNTTFEDVFNQNMASTRVPQFWEPPSDFGKPSASEEEEEEQMSDENVAAEVGPK